MNQIYEERLGTDRMLPLIFRMALPAIVAQMVNLLYNIVDRIYIGHIPGIGTPALAGIGVAGSIIILISAFSSIVAGGGAPLAAIALGQGNRQQAGKILGNGFILLLIFTVLTSTLAYIFMKPILLFTGASEQTLGYATDYLSIYLIGTLFVEISVGLNTFINTQGRPGIVVGNDRRLPQYHARSAFHFWFQHGSKRSGISHDYFTGRQRHLGVVFSDFFPRLPSARKAVYETGQESDRGDSGFRHIAFYHGQYGKPGRFCAERYAKDIRRYLRERVDRYAKFDAFCQCPVDRLRPGVRTYCQL